MPIEFAPPSAQVQPFQIPAAQYADPLETLARMGQLRTQNLQQQNAQLQLQMAQMKLQSQKGLLQAFADAGNEEEPQPPSAAAPPFSAPSPLPGAIGAPTTVPAGPTGSPATAPQTPPPSGSAYLDRVFRNAVRNGVLPDDLFALQDHVLGIKTKYATLTEAQQKIAQNFADIYSGMLTTLADAPNPDQGALNAVNAKARAEHVPEDMILNVFPAAQGEITSKQQIQAHANGILMLSQILENQLKGQQTQESLARTKAETLKGEETEKGLTASEVEAVIDPNTGVPNPADYADIQKRHPKVRLPGVPTSANLEAFFGPAWSERMTKELAFAASQANNVTDQASLASLRSKLSPRAQGFLPNTYDSSTPQKISRLGIPAPEQVTQALTAARDRVDAAYKNGQITLDQYKVYLDRLKNDPFGVLGSLPPPAVPEIMPTGAPSGAPAGGTSSVTPPAAGAPSPAPGEPIVTAPPKTIQDLAPAGQAFVSSPDGKTTRLIKLAEMPPLLDQGWTVSNTPLAQEPGGAVRLAPATGAPPSPGPEIKSSPFGPRTGAPPIAAPIPSAPQPTPQPVPGAGPGPPMSIGEAMRKGITGPALEQYIPPALKPQVNEIIRGLVPVPGSAGVPRSILQEQIMQIVEARDPNFSPLRYEARQRVLTGPDAPDIQALNTIPLHIDAALKAAEALKNGTFQPKNRVWNMFATMTGKTPTTDYNTFKTIVESDLARALGSQTIPEIQALGANLHDAQSPEQLSKALMNYLDATKKRMNVYEERLHQINPTDPTFSLITPSAREVLDRRLGTPTTPATLGGPYQRTATGPNGHRVGSNDGNAWYDVQTGKRVK